MSRIMNFNKLTGLFQCNEVSESNTMLNNVLLEKLSADSKKECTNVEERVHWGYLSFFY